MLSAWAMSPYQQQHQLSGAPNVDLGDHDANQRKRCR
jgi:hypothetical protein